ncbi:hypothetical protein F4779DRAFT_239335 [Xylariaceae sp. FL0662B]|nr:hypothetical protein F4779DRAFT_239335 [Xylariaceae sp. FL0662B]
MQQPMITALVAVALLASTAQCAPTHQFDQFFPSWDPMLQEILRANCSDVLAAYRSGGARPGPGLSSLITPVIECVLAEFPEFRKAEMAASAVILGLLPTILQGLGSVMAETALLSLRRPVLAFLLAAGSPAVAMVKGSEFVETVADFVEGGRVADLTLPRFAWDGIEAPWRPLLSAVEYALVAGAVANVVILAYQLGVHAIVVFVPETIFAVPLWTFLSVLVHIGAVVALHLRVKSRKIRDEERYLQRRSTGFGTWVPNELVPSAFQPAKRLEWRRETVWFHAISWLLSIGTVANTAFGTLVLSSLLFFSVVDSLIIGVRYAASAIVCRAIVRLELSGMKEATQHASGKVEEEIELTTGLESRMRPDQGYVFRSS